MAFSNKGAFGGATSGAMIGATLAAPTGGISVPVGALLGTVGGLFGGGLFGGDSEGPNIDISAEMARIDALYEKARTHGIASITQDFQAQRGELAQSQAARGILRSGVSQLGLARLGAGRQQAISQFESNLAASQAGQQSSLLNALMGRKFNAEAARAERNRIGFNDMLGAASGLAGAYSQSRIPRQEGVNFAGTGMVSPSSPTGRGFFSSEFGGGYGSGNLSGAQILGMYNNPGGYGSGFASAEGFR